mgnify:CR=1 FL=1
MNPIKFVYHAVRALVFPKYRFLALAHRGFYDNMPDEEYLKRMYEAAMGRKLDLDNPKTFNEKLQWLKLYDRRSEYTALVDKYEAKSIIAGMVGSEYVIPNLGVWDSFDDIDFDALPSSFVLKCNNDSGSVIVVQDKSRINKTSARRIITSGLKTNYYLPGREWVYKNIKPRVLAEEYLPGKLVEYKIFCFDGKPGIILVCKGKAHALGRTNDYYDIDFRHLPVTANYPNSTEPQERPAQLDEILRLAEKLSAGIPHVRVDTYLVDGRVYVGEMTFYHNSGYTKFTPESWDEKFGEFITLPEKRS